MRLVAIDLDGTLLDPDHALRATTIRAVTDAVDAGLDVVIASSRGPASIQPIMGRLGLTGEFIAAQGAITGRFAPDGTLTVIDETPIPLPLAQKVVTAALRLAASVSWIAGMEWSVPWMDAQVDEQTEVLGRQPVIRDLRTATQPPHKLLAIVHKSRVDMVDPLLRMLPPGVTATLSHPNFVEITAEGVDKGAALERLCHRHGIAAGEVAAIGDGHNDAGMLRFAGTAVAMGNAVAELRAEASLITGSNAEDGVAAALRTLVAARSRS
ncbi:Cof-type HAD-IIB family hydrolase [Leifsonia bigeumensis]|uniref:Cof-type HAD-IIB family hydrolase n=2 Tax=Leifsonella bigeumensis TaxID=433643 RepID=A0ABP7EZM0_9MICO